MGPFYESKREREGHYVIEEIDEGGTPSIGFVESLEQLADDVEFSKECGDGGVYVLLGRVVNGVVVDQDTGRVLGPVEKVVKANWKD